MANLTATALWPSSLSSAAIPWSITLLPIALLPCSHGMVNRTTRRAVPRPIVLVPRCNTRVEIAPLLPKARSHRHATADKASSSGIDTASSVQPCHGRSRLSLAVCHGQSHPSVQPRYGHARLGGSAVIRSIGHPLRSYAMAELFSSLQLDMANIIANVQPRCGHRASPTQPYYGLSRHC